MEEAKKEHGLKAGLPDFYNMQFERPREDARGYGLLYVDVSAVLAIVDWGGVGWCSVVYLLVLLLVLLGVGETVPCQALCVR